MGFEGVSNRSTVLRQTADSEKRRKRKSNGSSLRLCEGFRETGSRGIEERSRKADEGFTGLVARGLWPLWALVYSYGLAQRGDVPNGRRSRRGRLWDTTICAAQQLAGQRESRQGSAFALADQTEVRKPNLLG